MLRLIWLSILLCSECNREVRAATPNTMSFSKAKAEFLEAITWMDELQGIRVVKCAPKRFFERPLNDNLDTPLHLACQLGSILIVVAIHSRVLNFQSLLSIMNKERKNPVHTAQENDNHHIVTYFKMFVSKL